MQIPAQLITIAAIAAAMIILVATAIIAVAHTTHIAVVAATFILITFFSAGFKIFAETATRQGYSVGCSAHFTGIVVVIIVIIVAVAAIVSVAVEQVPAKNAAISEATTAIVSVIIVVCHVMPSFNLSYSTGYDKSGALVNDK